MTDGSDSDDPLADAEWPTETPRYRLQTPATDDDAPLDVLATVLDESPRSPATATVRVGTGRRDDRDHIRHALADLAAHSDVAVGHEETSGTVPLTDGTFAALADVSPEIRTLVVRDDDGLALVTRRDERFTFALPDDAIEAVESSLPSSLRERLEEVS
ncbi:hypothetical protein GOC74_05740 [Halomicrobium mukohataei]|uniref:Uncharacterized protein n=1 Tax=Halomicrobium mukohataei TaxID=57705 RepID=A0A847UEB3_9EURY|nr:hypothetical protein [Halomicrobium mukohataei]NLV09428.1 hypothetical protein [Halomicrobium mukohataei]